jgi:hypothetical protein
MADNSLEILQWLFIVLQILALAYFNYYTFLYYKSLQGNRPDPLSIACFLFVELTLFAKTMLRSIAIISINVEYPNKTLDDALSSLSSDNPLLCNYNLAYFFGIMFFTQALILNAVRWVKMIMTLHKGLDVTVMPRKVFSFGLWGLIILMLIVAAFRMFEECTQESLSNVKLSLIIFDLVMQSINILAIVSYSYACFLNRSYLRQQI